jgi:hydroxyacylglutathione hydrolase
MSVQIYPFESSINTCYILKDKGVVLIDAGWANATGPFLKTLAAHQIEPKEVQLIILTHGDFDHAGGTKQIRELTGAKVVIHRNDRDYLEKGLFHYTRGATPWGKISRFLFVPILKKKGAFPPSEADIVMDDRDMPLRDYGIPGKIVYTPGHTMGSVSVLLESGEAFAGCLAHNRFPFRLRPRFPIYAENPELIRKSWKTLIEQGATMIYPGHGKPFPVEKILKYVN